jgi:hypothetical protein
MLEAMGRNLDAPLSDETVTLILSQAFNQLLGLERPWLRRNQDSLQLVFEQLGIRIPRQF